MGYLPDLDELATDFIFFFSFSDNSSSALGAFKPPALLGSKKPSGFGREVTKLMFFDACSASNKPAAKVALGSSDKLTKILFIRSISTV